MSTSQINRLHFKNSKHNRYTHYLFRYPAKFHPPIVRALLKRYSAKHQTILDPFCGSGTLLVEALIANRSAVGIDVDPVATFVSRVKTRPISTTKLQYSSDQLMKKLNLLARPDDDYTKLMFVDISDEEFSGLIEDESLFIPSIPNILHWFRRYVLIDLARIHKTIEASDLPPEHKNVFLLCFASVLRNVSNADPVPVSGLEVTSHMRTKNERGRLINPFNSFSRKLKRALRDIEQFSNAVRPRHQEVLVICEDVTHLSPGSLPPVDVVITSPPYHNAVDYYRRHTLEMYWLNLVRHQADRLELLPKYIGRSNVRKRHPYVVSNLTLSPLANEWEQLLRAETPRRAIDFRHYIIAMNKCFSILSETLIPGSPAIFILGRSTWGGREIPTDSLFEELSRGMFTLQDKYWYPIKNRYMSYSRHNHASIDREYVLIFEKT